MINELIPNHVLNKCSIIGDVNRPEKIKYLERSILYLHLVFTSQSMINMCNMETSIEKVQITTFITYLDYGVDSLTEIKNNIKECDALIWNMKHRLIGEILDLAVSAKTLAVQRVSLYQLLPYSDYVILACPLTDETKHLINANTLNMMKTTAALVNVAKEVTTPHMGGATVNNRNFKAKIAAENILLGLSGKPLLTPVI